MNEKEKKKGDGKRTKKKNEIGPTFPYVGTYLNEIFYIK